MRLAVVFSLLACARVALGGQWDEGIGFLAKQANATLTQLGSDRSHYPNQGTNSSGSLWALDSPGSWTCSFFVGILWRLSNASRHGVGGLEPGMADWYETAARSLLPALAPEENNTGTHDVGFMMEESFLLGYFLTGDAGMLATAVQGAKSLSTRFDSKLGVFRSWNSAAPTFEVIIDSAMNAPLLAVAGKETGNATLQQMAHSHWLHLWTDGLIRKEGSLNGCAFHLQVYNETSGATISLSSTPQGYNTSSLWSRGQSWAVNGFLQAYELTGDAQFLQAAQDAAQCWIRFLKPHNPPVPPFDFITPPSITYKDTSAAAIASDALLRLADIVGGAQGEEYRSVARTTLSALLDPKNPYRADPATSDATLLHGFTAWGSDPEKADVSLIYGDMYLLQALLYDS